MDTLIHADIFFFITTIAVAIVTVALVVVAFYLVGFLRRARDIAENVKQEAVLLREDIHGARTRVKAGGLRLAHLLDFFSEMRKRNKAKSRGRKNER
jgi:type II secretory pathway pseudopilin PulG